LLIAPCIFCLPVARYVMPGPCNAVPLRLFSSYSNENEFLVYGTNVGKPPYTGPQQCTGSTSGVAWYSLPATEGSLISNLTTSYNPYTNFDTTVSVYTGDCKNLQCVSKTNGSYISTETESGIYYIGVSGVTCESGSFQLSGNYIPGPPSNCTNPIEVYIHQFSNMEIVGSFDQTSDFHISNCTSSYGSYATAWYKFITKPVLVLHITTSDNANILVYSGECGNDCVTTCDTYNNTDSCSSVRITTYASEYYVAVFNTYSKESLYSLSFHVDDHVPPSACSMADNVYLMPYTPVTRVFSTAGQPPIVPNMCGGSTNSPAYWFDLSFQNATQVQLTVNTCSSQTTVNTVIGVFDENCKTCIQSSNIACSSGKGSTLIANMNLYGASSVRVGIYGVTGTGDITASFVYYPINKMPLTIDEKSAESESSDHVEIWKCNKKWQ